MTIVRLKYNYRLISGLNGNFQIAEGSVPEGFIADAAAIKNQLIIYTDSITLLPVIASDLPVAVRKFLKIGKFTDSASAALKKKTRIT